VTAVLLFARAPLPGTVKTRLAAEVGQDVALQAYRDVGARVARQVAERYRLNVWYDPPGAEEQTRNWLGAHEYHAQPAGDLGARMEHAFSAHFARGDRPVIAIGADAPGVTADTIAAAEAALREADVVLGPALDGGYYLLGFGGPHPELLADVPWGTADVLGITVARCRAGDLAVRQLEALRDLDTAADLQELGLARS
jgi:rSAM/selenodomain-associated transferase 1